MRQAGRKSAAALAIIPVDRRRPCPPPEHLSEEAKAIWRAIVGGLRHDWFQGAEHLLECYCQDVVIERQIAGELFKCSIGSERYGDLLRLFLAVVGSLAAVATKLRLTPQSTRDSRNVKLIPPGPYPWDGRDGDGDEAESSLAAADSSGGSERNFDLLLQRHRARCRSPACATLAATDEAADTAAFLSDEENLRSMTP